jgi:hypothetical protein
MLLINLLVQTLFSDVVVSNAFIAPLSGRSWSSAID